MSVCKRCNGSGTAPVDTKTDLEGVSASGICPDCNGTGESDGLSEAEESTILDLESELTTWKPIFEYINKIITERVKQARQDALEEVERALPTVFKPFVENTEQKIGFGEAIKVIKEQITKLKAR